MLRLSNSQATLGKDSTLQNNPFKVDRAFSSFDTPAVRESLHGMNLI